MVESGVHAAFSTLYVGIVHKTQSSFWTTIACNTAGAGDLQRRVDLNTMIAFIGLCMCLCMAHSLVAASSAQEV